MAEILERLVDGSRLLVGDRGPERAAGSSRSSDAMIELAHDKLLEAWPGLARQIKETCKFLLDHRRLTRAATAWITGTGSPRNERRRRRDLDLHLLKVIEASGLPADWLNLDETAYLAAARIERRRRTLQLWAFAATALTCVLTLFATILGDPPSTSSASWNCGQALSGWRR